MTRTGKPVGERNSARRDAILQVLQESTGALSAEEIHQLAQGHVAGLGIATVYRNVRLLHEAGVLRQVILADGQARYEPAARAHHHHFHCDTCHRTFCLEGCALNHAQPLAPKGFKVTGHEITFYGVCPGCQSK